MKLSVKCKVILAVIVIIALICLGYFILTKSNSEGKLESDKNSEGGSSANLSSSEEIEVVPTLIDEITSNSAWCATFQLVWNDMQNEVVGQDIVYNPQLTVAENLNKQTFTENDISDEYYYKNYGLFTLDLKEEIENGLAEKFDEPSDILELFDWSGAPQSDSDYDGSSLKKYFFYTMLYRKFSFNTAFDVLENSTFEGTNEIYENVEYFGIDSESSSNNLGYQVEVLYYNSEDDCAVILNTDEGDQVVLCKGCTGNTYQDIWNEVQEKSETKLDPTFTENDRLKVPMITVDRQKEYTELENDENGSDATKIFYDVEDNTCFINKAIQTIKFDLDETGGEIKSEAGILMMVESTMVTPEVEDYRYFYFDSTFTMFLLEDGKDTPYFAVNIDDITLFQ